MKGTTYTVVCVLLLTLGCGQEPGDPSGLEPLRISAWGPSTVVVGSHLALEGTGFIPEQLGQMTLRLEGTSGDTAVSVTGPLLYASQSSAAWVVSPSFIEQVGGKAPFVGTLTVTRHVSGYGSSQSDSIAVTLEAHPNLAPVLTGIEPDGVFVGDALQILGDNLLQAGEGQTLLVLSGEFHVQSPPMVKSFPNVAIPVAVESRTRATFTLGPDKFGIHPGDFVGSARLENVTASAPALASEPLEDVTFHVYRPVIEGFSPSTVRRGQRVQVTGRGFVATDPVGESATLILLEGLFETSSGKKISYQGNDAMLLFPETFADNTFMEVVLRVTVGVDGELSGLGLTPGVFTGTAWPQLFWGSDSFVGDGLEFVLTVAPQLQVVYVKYLPSFDDAFHKFGLHAVRGAVRAAILDRCNRDYSPFNVQFTDERPEDFAEYSVIELSGKDPNQANLLGLDNTTGKDNYNLRFNDVVGGKNAETQEQGYYAYGGVFLESFLYFSPTLSDGTTTLASPRFDDLFGPFVPELGGTPVAADEYPGSSRDKQIEAAVLALGNLVGGTVAHEIGHSLGLAMVPGHLDEYHNLGDNPAWLMDAGNYRPFEERAEIDGAGPEIFAPYNYEYLHEILPKG